MAFQVPLGSPQYTKLRGSSYAAAVHISVLRPVTELKARLSATPNGTSFAAINYNTVTVGAYTNVLPDETILISHTDNIRAAFFTGRVRSITASTINIGETSANITINDYIWVIRDWRLHSKLAREVAGVQYKDWDQPYSGQKPLIYDLKDAYADWVDLATGKYRVSFAPLDRAAQAGATISSRQWSALPAGATLISGLLTGANITVDFAPGDYFLHYTITDNGGRAQVRHIPVFAHDDTINPPALSFTGGSIQNTASAWSASLRAFAGVNDLLDGTLVVTWIEEYYNGARGSLFDNVTGVYRIRRENLEGRSDATYSYDADVSFELDDIATQLARLSAPKLAIRNVGSPTVWDEIASLTPQRAILHILETGSTFFSSHSLSFDSFDNTFVYDSFASAGSLLAACQEIAKSINAVLEFGADGRCIVSRDARYLAAAARSALPIIAAFTDGSGGTPSDMLDVSLVHADTRDVGRVDGSGGTYNTSTGQVDAYLSISPGTAEEGGGGQQTLTGQILAANSAPGVAKAELIKRSADLLELTNAPYRLLITHPDGYHWLTPSVAQWYTFDLLDTIALRGLTFNSSTRWLLESITLEQDNVTGTVVVRAVYVVETLGYGGIAFDAPKPGEIAPYLPDLPSFGPYDFAFPEVPSLFLADNPVGVDVPPGLVSAPTTVSTVPRDGNTQIIGDEGHAWVTRQFLKSADPPWTDVTPDPTHTVQDGDFDPFPDSKGHVGAYVLTTKAGLSYIWRTTNVFAAAPVWMQGGSTPGAFTALRTTSAKGHVLIEAPDVTATGYPVSIAMSCTSGCSFNTEVANNTMVFELAAPYTFGAGDITLTVQIDFDYRDATDSDGCFYPGTVETYADLGLGAGFQWYGNTNIFNLFIGTGCAGPNTNFGRMTKTTIIQHVPVTYPTITIQKWRWTSANATIDPMTVSAVSAVVSGFSDITGKVVVGHSSDYGATVSTVIVGPTPGSIGGLDRIVIGSASLAAVAAKVEIATTLGGAYTDEVNGAVVGTYPLAILIPSHKQNSTTVTNYNTATPEYVLATPALVSGAAVWWVKPSGKIDITPVIGLDKGLAVAPGSLAAWRGTTLMAILSFGGTRHLMYYNGTTWTDRGAVHANASMVKVRRRSLTPGQVAWTNGSQIGYSPNLGLTKYYKSTPSVGTLKFCEIWG